MQKTDASGMPVQWPASQGAAAKADRPLSSPFWPFPLRPFSDINLDRAGICEQSPV